MARGGGWMCGDLVSNHGTTGRASIERAEARPSYPILSFAWNHVGAGVVLVQTNPTQPTGLTLLRLHLRVSTDRPPPPPPPAPSLSTSSFASFSSSTAYCSSSSSSSSFSTSFYYCYCYYYRCCCYYCCCCCYCCRYSFATLSLPPHCYLPLSFTSTYCFSFSCLRSSVSRTTTLPPHLRTLSLL